MKHKFRINVSPARVAVVRDEIERGSEPHLQFYCMVVVSTGIAAFGLAMNSTAVVIGAMLVAPLMTPIFGMALAMVRGDNLLLGRAVKAVIAGVTLAVVMSIGIGFLIPELDVTEEMLSRTTPNLLDLLVAIFAGTAGAYAMIDERISPALPGVAISTAIVPPLANSGLCLRLESFQGASGSFLLFFANFLSILLVASIIFFAAGMAREFGQVGKKDLLRRFSLAAIGFILMTTFLSMELIAMSKKRHIEDVINRVLYEELAKAPATAVQEIRHEQHDDALFILAHVHSPIMFSPRRVSIIQNKIAALLETPTKLFFRSTMTQDVSATGVVNQIATANLDGLIYNRHPNERIKTLKLAEQAVRENLDHYFGIDLKEVNLLPVKNNMSLLVTLQGVRTLSKIEIKQLETDLREKTGKNNLDLFIVFNQLDLYDRWGKFNYEWSNIGGIKPEDKAAIELLEPALTEEFNNKGYALEGFDFKISNETYHIMLNIVGPRLFTQQELLDLKQKLSSRVNKKIKLFVRSRPEVVVGENGVTTYQALKKDYRKQTESTSRQDIENIIEEVF